MKKKAIDSIFSIIIFLVCGIAVNAQEEIAQDGDSYAAPLYSPFNSEGEELSAEEMSIEDEGPEGPPAAPLDGYVWMMGIIGIAYAFYNDRIAKSKNGG